MRCPNCGSEVKTSTRPSQNMTMEDMERIVRNQKWGGITCDDCPAIMTINYKQSEPFALATFLVAFAGIISLVALYALGAMILIPFYGGFLFIIILVFISRYFSKQKMEIIAMRPRCEYCGAIMETVDAGFCPKCGASTSKGLRDRLQAAQLSEIPVSQHIGTCMVCNFGLKADDLLVWCPHCGSPAHKTHLLEWVHVKNKCPKCGQHIDEREINLRAVKESARAEKERRIWRTV